MKINFQNTYDRFLAKITFFLIVLNRGMIFQKVKGKQRGKQLSSFYWYICANISANAALAFMIHHLICPGWIRKGEGFCLQHSWQGRLGSCRNIFKSMPLRGTYASILLLLPWHFSILSSLAAFYQRVILHPHSNNGMLSQGLAVGGKASCSA